MKAETKRWLQVGSIVTCGISLATGMVLAVDGIVDNEPSWIGQRAPAICYAIDGDTIECDDVRYRLNGIDAPELAGHCARGRDCVIGDAGVSKLSLSYALTAGPVEIQTAYKRDRWGRIVAQISAGLLDLSCEQLRTGDAVYVAKWDEAGRVKAMCPELAK